jgi:hypothetical protein
VKVQSPYAKESIIVTSLGSAWPSNCIVTFSIENRAVSEKIKKIKSEYVYHKK